MCVCVCPLVIDVFLGDIKPGVWLEKISFNLPTSKLKMLLELQ